MEPSELKKRVGSLSIWKKGEQRAPHKPLLLLYALGQLQSKKSRLLPYEEVRKILKSLLIEFGPARNYYYPEQPFVRLVNDGLWELSTSIYSTNINDKWLLNNGVAGGFSEEVYSLLVENEYLVKDLAEIILHQHFPESIHEDILAAAGLDFDSRSSRGRDPNFRDRILRAYEYSCAVCGFNVRLAHNLVAVEAAHIKWHQAGGPDSQENGLALCTMHHKLFDRGVYTITNEKQLLVAEEANGTSGFFEWLMRYHGKEVRSPIHPEYKPKEAFVSWHFREVFKGPARYRA